MKRRKERYTSIYVYDRFPKKIHGFPNVPVNLSSWSRPRFVKYTRTTAKTKVCSGQVGLGCD